jgi:hypothetical protein
MLLVFACVDLFSLYRHDYRAALAAGKVGGFTVNQAFLVASTAYVLIPSVMAVCALTLRPRVNRIADLTLSGLFAVTIVAGAIGEWTYYVVASAVEVGLLAAIAHYARTWPRLPHYSGSSPSR